MQEPFVFFFYNLVQCTSLVNSSSVTQLYKSDGKHSTVEFTCAPGYTLVGSNFATCDEDGIWNIETQPTCGM